MDIAIRQLEHGADLPLPAYGSEAAAGLDLFAAPEASQMIAVGARRLIGTGIAIQLPVGFEGQIRPRSGLAMRHGIGILNAPGTVDADYRGEIGVLLINWGDHDFLVERGMRIAQLVIAPVCRAQPVPCADLADSERGANGFGSTGLFAAESC